MNNRDAFLRIVDPQPNRAWTAEKKLEIIGWIRDVNNWHMDADDGDKHLASHGYAMEAIDAVLSDNRDSGILRQFLEASIPADDPEIAEPETQWPREPDGSFSPDPY